MQAVFTKIPTWSNTIGIKHGFSCVNIRQVSWEVLKTAASGLGLHEKACLILIVLLYGSNIVFHALTFARFRGRCWKPQPPASVFNTSQGTWRMFMHWKPIFDRYYCIKTENICYISRYFLHYFVSPFHRISRTQFPRTMLVRGPGSTHLVTAANLWPRYDHFESCVAVH